MFSSRLYQKAPVALQSELLSLRAWSRKKLREGKRFDKLLRNIRTAQYLSSTELDIRHEQQLGEMLLHAVTHVPFYRKLGISHVVQSAPAVEALRAFPIIDKRVVRERRSEFMADNARRPLFRGSTSGTTGTPLTLVQDLLSITREHAFIQRQLEWAGLKPGDRRAWIRGDLIVPADVQSSPFWRKNRTENMLMLSSYHLSDNNAASYIKALEDFNPVLIQAYPSSINFLARWLQTRSRSYRGKALRGIVTSSETLASEQKVIIEASFGCTVFDWYGLFERVAAIGTCPHGHLHLMTDYAHVELQPGNDGQQEIIGTNLNNRAMPLIRYRTNDHLQMADDNDSCNCSLTFPLVRKVIGREDDVLTLPDGRHISRLGHVFKDESSILEAQILQTEPGKVCVLIVPSSQFSDKTEASILQKMRHRLGPGIDIETRYVTSIPRTARGKTQLVVSNVKERSAQ